MVQIKKYSPNIEKLKTGGQTITGREGQLNASLPNPTNPQPQRRTSR